MPFVNRFSALSNAAITFTGNTLGLARSNTLGVPGNRGSLGAFITTDTSSQFGSYPPGTTDNFRLNRSSAILRLPPNATVEYAELIWAGSYRDYAGNENLIADIDNPITLETPAGSFQISPDPATAFIVQPSTAVYVRSSIVTDLVRTAGAGTYTAGGIVGTILNLSDNLHHAGWTLAVIYSDRTLPFRSLTLNVGLEYITGATPEPFTITGFITPPTGIIEGRLVLSINEGDPDWTRDQMFFGSSSDNVTAISGPNNFLTNFFSAQINGDDGLLDTSGTFGNRNSIIGDPGIVVVGARTGWDITNLDISSLLTPNQSTAFVAATTGGDAYFLNGIALQIDISAPFMIINKVVDRAAIALGDTFTFTHNVANTGTAPSNDVILVDPLPSGTEFVEGSVTIDSIPFPSYNPVIGIPLGTFEPNPAIVRTVTFQVRQTVVPPDNAVINQSSVQFTFPGLGGVTENGSVESNEVSVTVVAQDLSAVKSANKSITFIGDVITYTLDVTYNGNFEASVVLIGTPPPSGTSYLDGTVQIDGDPRPELSIASGFNLGVLMPGESVAIVYAVQVNSLPTNGIVQNQDVFFISTTNILPEVTRTANSNSVDIPAIALENNTDIEKGADLSLVVVGDVITYTLLITNNGPFVNNNVFVRDTLAPGLLFVTGSITVNGVPQPSASPETGIAVGVLAVGASASVIYRAQVISVPGVFNIVNVATLSYDFLAPDGRTITGDAVSNVVTIPIVTDPPNIELVKLNDLPVGTIGDTVNYAIQVTNRGTQPIMNAVIRDPLSEFAAFVEGSVTVDGVPAPSSSPASGIGIGNLGPNDTRAIRFAARITTVPPGTQLINTSRLQFDFVNSSGVSTNGSSVSNESITLVNAAQLTLSKSASVSTISLGNLISYTLIVQNTGNLPARNIVISDSRFVLLAIPGVVFINNILRRNVLQNGVIPIGDLAPGQQTVLEFKTIQTFFPDDGIQTNQAVASFSYTPADGIERTNSSLSNETNVNVLLPGDPNVTVVKSADKKIVSVDEHVTFTFTIHNSGNAPVFNTTVFETLNPDLTFIPGSLTLNGVPITALPNTNFPEILQTPPLVLGQPQGIDFGTLSAGETMIITAAVQVNSDAGGTVIRNQLLVRFTFVNSNGDAELRNILSNMVELEVEGEE